LIFAPFNFAVLFGSRNKGHADIKGFTVFDRDMQLHILVMASWKSSRLVYILILSSELDVKEQSFINSPT